MKITSEQMKVIQDRVNSVSVQVGQPDAEDFDFCFRFCLGSDLWIDSMHLDRAREAAARDASEVVDTLESYSSRNIIAYKELFDEMFDSRMWEMQEKMN